MKKFTPFQSILMVFVVVITIGTTLLMLPISSAKGASQPFIDALFTAVSAVSTTGLVVVDTGSYYSLFGQMIILILIQVGGLGYMVFVVLIIYLLRKKSSMITQITLERSMSGITMGNAKKVVLTVFISTFFIEFIGAVVLSLYWMNKYSIYEAIHLGIFHSVSTFCTSGFGLFSDSFMTYRGDIFINTVISIMSITGAMGFFVMYDLGRIFKKILHRERPWRIKTHTKLALITSVILILIGTVVIYFWENQSSNPNVRWIDSVFQSITASTTTGFNTIDIGKMSMAGLFMMMILMFIGGSPGSTAGGMKTTTFGVMLLSLLGFLRRKKDINIFYRRISPETILEAYQVGFTSILLVVFGVLVLVFTEKASFIQIVFETVSAFGTDGNSTGITASLSNIGKIVISVVMLFGRLGPLAVGFSLFGKTKPSFIRYPDGEMFVG